MNKKVILITGASSGIGYSTAKLLLKRGTYSILYCKKSRKHERASKVRWKDNIFRC